MLLEQFTPLIYFLCMHKTLTPATSLNFVALVAEYTYTSIVNAGRFGKEDCILISELYKLKGYGAKRLVSEFPTKDWKIQSFNKF
jgi:hypothetical protein